MSMTNTRGRKPIPINWTQVDNWILKGFKGPQISGFLNMDTETFYNHVKRAKKMRFLNYRRHLTRENAQVQYPFDLDEIKAIMNYYYHKWDMMSRRKKELSVKGDKLPPVRAMKYTGEARTTGFKILDKLSWDDLEKMVKSMEQEQVFVRGATFDGFYDHVLRNWIKKPLILKRGSKSGGINPYQDYPKPRVADLKNALLHLAKLLEAHIND